MTLSTHVLDTGRGVPAAGIAISLYALDGDSRVLLTRATTDQDGRTQAPLSLQLASGSYELLFFTGAYFLQHGIKALYDEIPIRFRIDQDGGHYHIPLLLGPWAYSTYRGS